MDTSDSSITRRRGGAKGNAASSASLRVVAHHLIDWYRENARDLPWRRTSDPYAILVSEFMCQQTTVAAVVPYFERWMAALPSVRVLAEADEQTVLGLWQGLGYYSRARNLHRAAQAVMERHGGAIPTELEALRALPGIGEYTAGAVFAFAFDRPAPVVDANVARVLARMHNLREPVESAVGRGALREASVALQDGDFSAREVNSAVMELGALVCKPRAPRCPECPIRGECRTSDPETLPVKRARQPVTAVTERRAFYCADGLVFLTQSTGRWRGMWILPLVDREGEPDHVEVYPITRYLVRMELCCAPPPPDQAGLTAFPLDALVAAPIPSPHRRAIQALAASGSKVQI